MAEANAQIGVAQAAFFPTLALTASGGLESSRLTTLLTLPSRFWAIGPSLVETVFDGGRRKALKEQAVANYDGTVAAYRQNTLTAFQDVEDNLAAVRVLADEALQAGDAVESANLSLELANNRYVGGVTTYLEVITAQTAAAHEPDHGRRRADATDDGKRPADQGARRWLDDSGFTSRLRSSSFGEVPR